jgi:hypothetical protein
MTTPIEKAERDLDNLEEQRENLFSRSKRLSQERDQIAFAALTAGDKKAKARLADINTEDIGLTANVASVEAALTVARQNLANARDAEAQAAGVEKAKQIADLNAQIKEMLDNVDDAFDDAFSGLLEARKLLQDIHAIAAGVGPSDQLFRINSIIAVKSVIQELPSNWISDFEFSRLAPSQKKKFKQLRQGWCSQIDNQIAQMSPRDKDKAA